MLFCNFTHRKINHLPGFYFSLLVTAFLLLSFPYCLIAQTAEEEEVTPCASLEDSTTYYFGKDIDKTRYWSNLALACGQTHNLPQVQGVALQYQAGCFLQSGQLDSALHFLELALPFYKKAKNNKGTIKVYRNIALCYHSMDQPDKAFHWLERALDFSTSISYNIGIAEAHQGLAVIHSLQEGNDKALYHLEEAQKLFPELGYKPDLKGATFGTMSEIYVAQKDYETGIEYRLKQLEQYELLGREDATLYCKINLARLYTKTDSQKALALFQELEKVESLNSFAKESATYYNAYSIFINGQGDKNQALELALTGYNIAKTASLKYLQAQLGLLVGSIYSSQGQLSLALQFTQEAQLIFQQNGDLEQQTEVEGVLVDVYSALGNYEEALEHARTYAAFKDSLYQEDLVEVTREAQLRFETAEKEQEIAVLEKDNAIQKLEAEKNRRLALFLGVLAVLLVTGGLFGLRLARQRQRLNEELRTKNQELRTMFASKNKLLRVLSHDIRTPLSYLKAALQMLGLKDSLNPEQQEEIQQRAIDTATFMESVTSKVLSSMSQENEVLEIKREALNIKKVAQSWLDQLQILATQKKVQLIMDATHENVTTDPILLQQIFNNLVSNAIKASPEASTVHIHFDQGPKKELHLQVVDEGIGYQQDKEVADGHGFGLKLVEYYVNLLNGSLNWKLNTGAGTTFQVMLP